MSRIHEMIYLCAMVPVLFLVGCGDDTSSPEPSSGDTDQELMAEWFADNSDEIVAIVAAFEGVDAAASTGDPYEVGMRCIDLRWAVGQAQDGDAIPIGELQAHWASALRNYSTGASYCISGADNYSADDLETAARYFSDGTDDIELVTSGIQEMIG